MSKNGKIVLAAVAAVAIIVAVYIVGAYNTFVRGSEGVNAAWAQVENQYQRRLDLIPNLVASVKGILKQEQTVFGDIAEARTRYTGAQTTDQKVAAANQMESCLARLLVIVENYPQLKSSENIRTLMSQLEGTENRVSVERARFNEVVKTYNIKVKTFPTKIVAGWFGFVPKTMFEAVPGAETAPVVNLEL